MQNREEFAMLDGLSDAGELRIETAISLREGKTVVIDARRTDEVLIAGEEHVPYIICSLYHDGTGSVKLFTNPTRAVCSNTLAVALKGAQRTYSIQHTIGSTARLAEARTAREISYKFTDDFLIMGEDLVPTKITDRDMERFLKDLVTDDKADGKKKRENKEALCAGMFELYTTSDNLNNIRGTKWGALNAVVEFNQHAKSYSDAQRRFLPVLDRQNNDQRALKLLVAAN